MLEILGLILFGVALLLAGLALGRLEKALSRKKKRKGDGFDPGPLIRRVNEDWNIVYKDRNGERTSRNISVKALYGDTYPKYAEAYCHLRREVRHFNLYNVMTATDVESGLPVPVTYHLLNWLDRKELRRDDGRITDLDHPLNIETVSGETWNFTLQGVIVLDGVPHARGRGTRARSDVHRQWTGNKTFTPDTCATVTDGATGEVRDTEQDIGNFFRGFLRR